MKKSSIQKKIEGILGYGHEMNGMGMMWRDSGKSRECTTQQEI